MENFEYGSSYCPEVPVPLEVQNFTVENWANKSTNAGYQLQIGCTFATTYVGRSDIALIPLYIAGPARLHHCQ